MDRVIEHLPSAFSLRTAYSFHLSVTLEAAPAKTTQTHTQTSTYTHIFSLSLPQELSDRQMEGEEMEGARLER